MDLFLKIRVPLLSDHALKFLLSETLHLYNDSEYVLFLKQFNQTKKMLQYNKSINFYTNRYCNQNKFNIITCGGYNFDLDRGVRDVKTIDPKDLSNFKALPQITKNRRGGNIVCVKSEIFVIGGDDHKNKLFSVEKYSSITKSWNIVATMYDYWWRPHACAFINSIFVIGGMKGGPITDTCMQFDTKTYKFKEAANLIEAKWNAGCSVFGGRIVISGGTGAGGQQLRTNTVQAYDHVSNTWSYMPNMIEKRNLLRSVAIKNKLYIIGGMNSETCEVFDSTCKRFVLLNPPLSCFGCQSVVSIGSKILMFKNACEHDEIICYDVEKNEWSEKTCKATTFVMGFCCVKVPQLLMEPHSKLMKDNSKSTRKLKIFTLPAAIIVSLLLIVYGVKMFLN